MDIPEYTFKEIGYSGSLQDIANILEYPQEQLLFSGKAPCIEAMDISKLDSHHQFTPIAI